MTSNFSLLTSSFWMNVSPLKMESKFIVFRRPFNHHLEMLKTCLIYRFSVRKGIALATTLLTLFFLNECESLCKGKFVNVSYFVFVFSYIVLELLDSVLTELTLGSRTGTSDAACLMSAPPASASAWEAAARAVASALGSRPP